MKVTPVITAGDPAADPRERNLFELFADQVRNSPEAVAVVDGSGPVSYAALAGRAAVISRFLIDQGLTPEQPVGVLMARTAEVMAVLLGILHAGGAYVPFDPDDPVERNRHLLGISGCRLILGDRALLDLLGHGEGTVPPPPAGLRLFAVEDIPAGPVEPREASPGGPRLAYVLFTSGSTGQPKGVEIEHRSVINLLLATRELLDFGPTDRFLAASTLGFDISVAEIFLPLVCGGSVLLRDRRLLLDPRALAAEVVQHRVTVIETGPSVWSWILSTVPEFPRVRVLITTSEAISPALAARLVPWAEQVWNLYGPTEATIWASARRITAESVAAEPASATSVSIGGPLGGSTLHVRRADGSETDPGEPGELWIGGPGLARGYRGDPQLTADRFPPAGPGGTRLYRTGDLVARAANETDGLCYLGRIDDQLKIRGVRIEPREIEGAIRSHPDVRDAAATWYEVAEGGRGLAAAVVVATGARVNPAGLHEWVAGRLPPPMVPSRFILCETLPLTPSGKVDRREIRRLAGQTPTDDPPAAPVAAPSRTPTPTEAGLMELWRSLLRVPELGVDAHFFSLGGDSLAAARMMMNVQTRFAVVLPVHVAFESPTIETLATRIDQASTQASVRTDSPFIFPLSRRTARRPLFFADVDLSLASGGKWTAPCPLYGITLWAQGREFVRAGSLAELARTHVIGIRGVQPRGPYRLAGNRFGGLVALEIARQLRREGESIDLLFLLDPFPPGRFELSPAGGDSRPSARPYGPGMLGRLVPLFIRQWVAYRLAHLGGSRQNPIAHLILPRRQWPAVWYAERRLASAYTARPHPGPSLAVLTDPCPELDQWRSLLPPGTTIEQMRASSYEMFSEPALGRWMNLVSQHLRDS